MPLENFGDGASQNKPKKPKNRIDSLEGLRDANVTSMEKGIQTELSDVKKDILVLDSFSRNLLSDLPKLEKTIKMGDQNYEILEEILMKSFFGNDESLMDFITSLPVINTNINKPLVVGNYIIQPGSDVAKMIQLVALLAGGPVQFKNKQSLAQMLDGKIGRFTLQGIAHLKGIMHDLFLEAEIEGIKDKKQIIENIIESLQTSVGSLNKRVDTQEKRVDTQEKILQQQRVQKIKGLWSEVLKDIVKTSGKKNSERNPSIEIKGDIIELTTYGQTMKFDLKTGFMESGSGIKFPHGIHLIRDNDEGPLQDTVVLDDKTNEETIKTVMKLMNIINFAIGEGKKHISAIDDKNFYPYELSQGRNLQFTESDGWFDDLDILKYLDKYLKNASNYNGSGKICEPKDLVNYLNILFYNKYAPKNPTKTSTTM